MGTPRGITVSSLYPLVRYILFCCNEVSLHIYFFFAPTAAKEFVTFLLLVSHLVTVQAYVARLTKCEELTKEVLQVPVLNKQNYSGRRIKNK